MTQSKDEFGDRMKSYEATWETRLDGENPVVVRLDGRSFSKFTKGLDRPFDWDMSCVMGDTTSYLVDKTHALIGYTQSDEITLVYNAPDNAELLFGGRVQKMASVLSGMTSAYFALNCAHRDRVKRMVPHFDCRVYGVPSETEATNALLWRAQDCYKNAVQMVARMYFSSNQLYKKSQRDIISMLEDVQINMNMYLDVNVYGAYFQRKTRESFIEDDIWNRIPEGKRPESRLVMRSMVERVNIRRLVDVKNRVDVVFREAAPQYV